MTKGTEWDIKNKYHIGGNVTQSIVPKLENGRNVSTPNQVQSLKRKCIEKYVILFKLKPGV